MNWWIAVPVGWTVVALLVGLLVGRAIRIQGGVEPECPVTRERAPQSPAPDGAEGPAGGGSSIGVAADPAGWRTDGERRGAQTRESSLAGAR